ncbi:MAG: hypothetical protein AB1777_06155 [Bacteroidota bacterium]
MITCLVTESNKLSQYSGNNFFNHTIEANYQLPDDILQGICEINPQTIGVFKHSELLVVDTNSKASYTITANALRAGINVLTPNLINYSSEQIQELITIAHEIGVDLGFLPNTNFNLPNTSAPIIMDCYRESGKELNTENALLQITSDLAYLLSAVKAEFRKVRVYWLPLYSQPFKTLKLIIDFNDNSVITYLIKGQNETGLLKIELITDELNRTFDIKDCYSQPEMFKEIVNQNIDYYINQKEMMFTSNLALKAKQIVEIALKKICY